MIKETRSLWPAVGTGATLAGCSHTSQTTSPSPFVKAPLTKTQRLGVDVLKTLESDPRLNGAQISVGTSATMVTLDGKVPSASAKAMASQITKKRAPAIKILNRLVVAAATPQANLHKGAKPPS